MHRSSKPVALILLLIASSYLLPTYAEEPIAAKWEAQQIRFTYSGFGTHYTCDGIRYKVEKLLLELGARDDVRIESSCTSRLGEAQRFHKLLLAFAMPVPAEDSDITEETFPAKWKEVRLRANRPRDLGAAECELVEQFNRQVVSKLDARDIENRLRCIPREYSFSAINLKMTVLKQQKDIELEPERNNNTEK